jgi:hypothetical protein
VLFVSGDDRDAKAVVVDLSIRLAWPRSTSVLLPTAVRCSSSAPLCPLWNCTSSAGSFAKLS